ncbi:MAG: PadR family transcriptional regulator [Chloroflexi bacterium]|nr:MAG: PadR family transcriptional regulator [Chloroflexota bacterium]MBL1193828.1 PadR family transcriptional regulator [Chloroflexota bacterium]NOH11122.1 PadR family transcriptional regulator [Chloroflexota bacterium]
MDDKNLPLTETTFLILVSIAKRPIHGYGIINDVMAVTDGRVELSAGTLYGALKRMLENGWIVRDEVDRKKPRERIEYRISRKGRSVLNAEIARLESILQVSQDLASVAREG